MTETKYSLPPRKWYTLDQAAKRISKLTGEDIEVADLLHYAFTNKLELCFFVRYKEGEGLIIDGEQKRYFSSNNEILPLPNMRLVFFDETLFELLNRNSQAKNDYQENAFAEIYDEFSYLQIAQSWDEGKSIDLTLYEGLIAIYLESIRIIPSDLEIGKLLKVKIAIKYPNLNLVDSQTQIPRASNNFQIITFNIETNEEQFELVSEIKIDNLLISKGEIELFLENKLIEKPTYRNLGRPTKDIKSLVLEIAKETFKFNPQASPNKLATAIFNYAEQHYFEEYGTIDLRTILNYLKDEKIGLPNSRNPSKVTIKDPLKYE